MKEEKKESKIPKFITDLGEDKYQVICKHNTYVLEEKDGKTFETCKKLSEKLNISIEQLLVMRSLIEPKISDDDFDSIKGSDYLKLHAAIIFIYGLNDFL